VALVMGNGAYAFDRLRNPVNDATDLAQALGGFGFKVILLTDGTRRQMRRTLRQFKAELKLGAVALFYYAGHGVQVAGKNYLIPVDADIESEADVADEALDANLPLAYMEEAGTTVNVVILDACRNNPFARSFRSSTRGLAAMEALAKGTFIAYATAPGSVAYDGEGRNGIYAKHLLANLKDADSEVERVFKRVRSGVAAETGNRQIPWDTSSLLGTFEFRRATPAQRGGAGFLAPKF